MGLTDKTPTITAYATSLGTAAGAASLTVNEWVAICGLGLAVATFAVNAVYKHLHYRLEKARHVAENKDH
ncbi:HP1 family phage holin [Telmatospirillum sp. J64-1]|uniref:HP1 family phage holin n=1 Tax=Telmatospirillum sp. J64-1 TaxID=2502183 RepID=UPI00115ED134|nr:HP1 family phage holin [Telmatospirillum sp. J64-1]